ncbi:MerR family transcriptional regulator [Methanococcus sp. CF]
MIQHKIPIGKFSVITQLSKKALHYYDKKEILVPELKDMITGYRYYSVSQIKSGIKIKTYLDLGFSLENIFELITAEKTENNELIHNLIENQIRITKKEIKKLQKIQKILESNNSEEVFNITLTDIKIKEIPELRVISSRKTGPIKETCHLLVEKLMKTVFNPENQKNGVKITSPVMKLCHDSEFDENNSDVEMVLPISGKITVNVPEIEIKTLPKCKCISTVYTGPYENLGIVYSKLFEYMAENNLVQTLPDRELYINSPHEVESENLITELQIPFKKEI